jgi:cytochrome P450
LIENFQVIQERKQEILEKVKDLNNNCLSDSEAIDEAMNKIGTKRRLVFLDILINYHLKSPQKMNEIDVRSEVDTFMFGGHDTTASSLMFALLLIGHDSVVQVEEQKIFYTLLHKLNELKDYVFN